MWKFHCMPMKLEFMRWMENIEEIGNGKSMKKHNGLKIFIMILVIAIAVNGYSRYEGQKVFC